MKKVIQYSLFLLFISFLSCKSDMIVEDIQGEPIKEVVIEADDLICSVESRTTFEMVDNGNALFKWVQNDTLGIFPSSGGYQVAFPLENFVENDASTAIFQGGGWALISGENYRAYYPFAYNNRDLERIPISYFGQKQKCAGDMTHLGAYDYMYTNGAGAVDGSVNFNFHHLGTLLVLKVTMSVADELSSIQLISSEDETFIDKGYYNLKNEVPEIVSTQKSNAVTLSLDNVSVTAGNEVLFYVWTAPFKLSGDLDIIVYGKNKWYIQKKKDLNLNPQAATFTPFKINGLEEGGNIVEESQDGVYEISNVSQLVWFANQVNSGNSFKGKTVKLTNDIDLNNEPWTPIGDVNTKNHFSGTFDGNNMTISNLNVKVEDGAAGLFGSVQNCLEIKNLKIKNAVLESNHYAGAIVGWMQENGSVNTSKIVGCSVDGVKIKVSPNETTNGYDNGDKAGGIVGYAASDMEIIGCSVNNASIIGYRDLGGIVGHANSTKEYGNVTISNCVVTNSTIAQDLTNGYKNPEPITLGAVWGRGTTDGDGNTHTNVKIICMGAVASVGDAFYSSLEDAIVAIPVSVESTINLMKSVDLQKSVVIPTGKVVVLDLNGNTLTGTDDATGSFALIELSPESNLSIINGSATEGKICLKSNNDRSWNAYSSVVSNQRGTLSVGANVVIEHLGGTAMAYGIDNLTNTGSQAAVVTIDGATVKSTYRAIRQFLNSSAEGVKNELYVNCGVIEGVNKSIWMQDSNVKANPGKLVVKSEAELKGDVYLTITEGSTEWPVEVSIAASALQDGSQVLTNGNLPEGYLVAEDNGVWTVVNLIAEDGTYQIANLAALKWFADQVNTGSNYFAGKIVILTNDIDLNNEEWTPIGSMTKDHGFCGNFDGNNKTIKNLKITQIQPDEDGAVYAGLFGLTEGTDAEHNYIKNLTIENVNINSTGDMAAALVGYAYYTDIEGITVKGNITITGNHYTAGILAYTRRCVNAKNLTITGNQGSTITGNNTVGGVISDIQMNGGLTANYSNFKASGLTITAQSNVGGISGIICNQTLDGATVDDIKIVSDRPTRGTISGALGGKTATIKNISVTNVTGATQEVGAVYETGAEVVREGDVFKIKETNN